MVLHMVGLGLGDHKDVTVKGMEAVKSSAHVYLEAVSGASPVRAAVPLCTVRSAQIGRATRGRAQAGSASTLRG
jgi:diphthamide biosynthesis methyltransferase